MLYSQPMICALACLALCGVSAVVAFRRGWSAGYQDGRLVARAAINAVIEEGVPRAPR